MKVYTVIEMDSQGTTDAPILFETREDAEKCAQFICDSYMKDYENVTSLEIYKKIDYWEVCGTDDGVKMMEIRVLISEENVVRAGQYGRKVRRLVNINNCDYCMEPFDSETYCDECKPRN